MPRDVRHVFEDTASPPTRPVDAAGIVRRARRQRTVYRAASGTLVAAVALAVVMLGAVTLMNGLPQGVVLEPGPGPSPQPEEGPAGWPDRTSFENSTGLVLLFDDGLDGVVAVDLDAGLVARRPLDGQRAGDSPYRLWSSGTALVVGWERIYAVSLATAESTPLGEATVFVPASEPGHVWLIDSPGGGETVYRLVDVAGQVRHESPGAGSDAAPAVGLRGGLALETGDGVAVWDLERGEITSRLGAGPAFVADAADRTIVWCQGGCARLHVSDLDGAGEEFSPPGGHDAFDARSARLSPDGRFVAAIAQEAGPLRAGSTGTVVLLEVATGNVTPVTPALLPRPAHLAWSADGTQLLFSSHAYGASRTHIGRYAPAEGHAELATLPVGGTLSFVPVDRQAAGAFLEGAEEFGGR